VFAFGVTEALGKFKTFVGVSAVLLYTFRHAQSPVKDGFLA
jgi:hypothetical protein